MDLFEKLFSFFMSIVMALMSLISGGATDRYKFEDVSYGPNGKRNTFDLYLPKDKAGKDCGLVLNIHGGWWMAGNKHVSKDDIKHYCGEDDVAVAAINYTYISEDDHMDTLVNDITLALAKIKETAATKNIFINKVLLTGFSAGAHLSLLYAYKCRDISPIPVVSVVSYSGPTDLTDKGYLYDKDGNRNEFAIERFGEVAGMSISQMGADYEAALPTFREYSPLTYVDKDCPPTVFGHGVKDSIVPYANAVALNDALEAAGVEHTFITFPNSDHGLDSDEKQKEELDNLLEECVVKYLK